MTRETAEKIIEALDKCPDMGKLHFYDAYSVTYKNMIEPMIQIVLDTAKEG